MTCRPTPSRSTAPIVLIGKSHNEYPGPSERTVPEAFCFNYWTPICFRRHQPVPASAAPEQVIIGTRSTLPWADRSSRPAWLVARSGRARLPGQKVSGRFCLERQAGVSNCLWVKKNQRFSNF